MAPTDITFVVGVGIVALPIVKDPDELWHARFAHDGQFYAGNGPTAFAAIAWALDEYAHRIAGHVRMAISAHAKPTLDVAPAGPSKHASTFAREPVRLPLAGTCTPSTKAKTAAARRARSKKGGARG
jgi:hypothetical protein